METKQGILKYIAGSAAKGVKFEDEPNTWYNPSSEEVKQQIKDEYKGRMVDITLVEGKKTVFSSMALSEEPTGEDAVVTEEKIDEEPEEEKVPAPPKEEAEEPDPELLEEDEINAEKSFKLDDHLTCSKEELYYALNQIEKMNFDPDYDCESFDVMNKTKVQIDKKGSLNYASWAEVWKKLKQLHPTSTYRIHENREGMPFFNDAEIGAFVKVSVTVMDLTHTVHLPVMNNTNKAAKGLQLDVVLINKNIQRAFAKAIAMHGIGLYVYNGEDYPEEEGK